MTLKKTFVKNRAVKPERNTTILCVYFTLLLPHLCTETDYHTCTEKNITHTLLSLHTYKESTQFTSHTRRKSIHIPFFDPALHTNTNTERYQHIHEGRGDSNSFILHLMCTCLIVLDWTTTTLPTPSPTPSTSSSGRRSIDEVYTFDILSVTDV